MTFFSVNKYDEKSAEDVLGSFCPASKDTGTNEISKRTATNWKLLANIK